MKKTLSNLMRTTSAKQVAMFFFIAMLSRILVLVYIGKDVRNYYTFDSSGYVLRAYNLLDYGIFSGDQEPPFTPDMMRTPVYPIFLGTVMTVFGNNISTIILIQIFLGSITAVITFLIAKELNLSTLSGLVAAWIVALDPVSILSNNILLTETLFTFLLILGIWLLILFWHNNQTRLLILSAILISISALTRPIAQFLPLTLFPFFIVVSKGKTLRTTIKNGLIFVFICSVILSLWGFRNYQISGRFTLTTITDINLLYYRARAVLAKVENITQDEAKVKLIEEIETIVTQQDLSQAEIMSLQRRRAISIFKQYPVQTTVMLVKGAGRLLVDPGFSSICTTLDTSNDSYECFPGDGTMLESGILSKVIGKFQIMTRIQQMTLVWSSILIGIVYLGLLVGVTQLIKERNWRTLLVLGVLILYFVLLSAGGETNSRFRVPIQPYLAILSGVGYEAMYSYAYNRHHSRVST